MSVEPTPSGFVVPASLPFVSVVIPTHGRAGLLASCLGTLLYQSYPSEAYEIVVVEDRPYDGQVASIVERARGTTAVPIRHLISHGKGPAAARNKGWRMARGEIIAFTDDDVLVDPQWLAQGVKAFNDGVVGVAGKTTVPLPPNPTDYERNVGRLAASRFVTCNVFYRKSGLEAVCGFDERFERAFREDTDLVFALQRQGCKLVECDEVIVVHPPRPASWMISVRDQSKQFYDALLFKKHPVMFRKLIKPHPPWNYYAITLFYLGFVVAAVIRNWPLAGLAAFSALGLVGEFLLRRLRGISKSPGHVVEMVLSSFIIPPVAVYWRLRGAWRYRVRFL